MKIAEVKYTMKRVAGWFILINLLLLACASPKIPPPNSVQTSSLVIKLSLEDLIAQAGLIVVGTIASQKSQWNSEHTQIHTLVTVAVEEWVKGKPRDNEVTIKIAGGQVGEISQRVGNTPTFRTGEKVLVFLTLQDDNSTTVVGGWQGKLVIENSKIAGSDVSIVELTKQIKAQSGKDSK